jgi:hypothetical protein
MHLPLGTKILDLVMGLKPRKFPFTKISPPSLFKILKYYSLNKNKHQTIAIKYHK